MITDTLAVTTEHGIDSITVTTNGEETHIYFFTDGTCTGGPDYYETDSGRLREVLQGYVHDGYKLVGRTGEEEA